MPTAHTIATRTHGRYLVSMPANAEPHPWMLGFHGYGENAEQHMAVLEALDPRGRWGKVSVQGLHRFYTRREAVVASWMTREDRDHAIADNVTYVAAVAAAVRKDYGVAAPMVCVGFSQGAAMAYRAAASGLGAAALIVLGGDMPPDVRPRASSLPPVLLGCGRADDWYTSAKREADVDVLTAAGVPLDVVEFDGGHEWHETMIEAAQQHLDRLADASDPHGSDARAPGYGIRLDDSR